MEKKGNRKEWVKNVAIIFLTILLILTFFSNTIMNYSLPEVATAMVEPGSITAKIRGTGTLTSDDPYKITIEETRVVSSVAVKAGDTVEKDQILFYLEDKESDELEKAEEELLAEEKTLDDLILAFSTKILEGAITNESYQTIQSGKISTNNEYQIRIEAAKQKVKSAEDTLNSLDRQISIIATSSSSSIDKDEQLERAKQRVQEAEKSLAGLEEQLAAEETKLVTAKAQVSGDAVKLMEEKHKTEQNFQDQLSGTYENSRVALENAMKEITSAIGAGEAPIIKEFKDIGNINVYLAELNKLYENAKNVEEEKGLNLSVELQNAASEINNFQKAFEATLAAKVDYENAAGKADQAVTASQQIASLEAAVNQMKNTVNQAKNTVNERQAEVISLQNEISNNKADSEKQKSNLSITKIQAEAALKEAQSELTQLLTDISNELNLDYQNDMITDQRKKVEEKRKEMEKIREKSIGTTIKAPVAGVVTSINITAGEKADPTRELAMMQPEGKGFSMSFSVTAEQAKKVKVGDMAEIQNSWFYNDIEATLAGIRPDPENSAEKKLLVFDVKGDVQAGQSISLSIGQKSADYDLLVPNSAVREDNQGKFILIVESKNSPLGNRYIARRVDVEVLGADDLKTAISAALYGYEYVITTATQPVEAGKQIRLADSD